MRRFAPLLALWLGCAVLAPAATNSTAVPAARSSEPTRISIDYPDTEVRRVLRDVADYFELNLILPEELAGTRTSITVRNATWPQIFDAVLIPLGYTYHDDENILRVVRRTEDPAVRSKVDPTQSATAAGSDEPRLLWFLVALNALPLALKIPVGIAHTILFIVVLRDRPPMPPRFAAKWVWATATLISGFVGLCAYWILHHARQTPLVTQRPEHR